MYVPDLAKYVKVSDYASSCYLRTNWKTLEPQKENMLGMTLAPISHVSLKVYMIEDYVSPCVYWWMGATKTEYS